MRFFDEDNNRFQRTMIAVAIVMLLYYASYYVIREAHTVRFEREGCPISGCEIVSYPSAAFYYVYNPLIHLDRYTSPDVVFMVAVIETGGE